ncbi:Cysteine proteinase inhibitor 10 [Linum perenne]
MKNLTALLVVLAAAAAVATSVEDGHSRIGIGMVGARREVEDVKSNWEIQELGRFSVSEFNTKVIKDVAVANQHEHLLLSFKEVSEAQTQVVSGIKYYLKIIASKSNHHQQQQQQLYDAAVVVKPWLNHRSLTLIHFRPSPSSMKIPHASSS